MKEKTTLHRNMNIEKEEENTEMSYDQGYSIIGWNFIRQVKH